ncbi:MAG: hypothetical protein CMI03_17230 [Oceanospirillaceae bacterium]|nr:hypothetical protein [Oceanospirillaceae bacterium]MBL34064.1 hypothetical protein [Oceanospirillaceae bacterium]MBS54484.1 hypothetical protein [Oceanospirillaceae bacterium]
MMLGRDMGPTVQVDIVLVQHLLNFWDGRGADILPILRALGISEFGPLPPWIAADKLREAQNRVEQQFTGSLIAAQSGRYLAERDLPMGRLMRCGENLAQSLPAALRFSHRSIGLASIQIDAGEDCVVLHAGTADGSSLSHGECQQALAAVAVLCRNALAGTYQSGDIRIVFSCARDRQDELSELLGVPVVQGDNCRTEISADAWIRINPDHHTHSFTNTLRELELKEKKLNEHLTLYTELREIIGRCLMRRHVAQEDVAAQLGISVRNLQRRLKALGTTYQVLLDESRQILAMRLIEDYAIPLYEIAYMVGYAEPSAFYKAFKRWTGSTPGDYRAQALASSL